MQRDAFTGGVEPGGLWNKNDIRILLCYILASVNAPLSRESISEIVQGKALANYFEVGDALESLQKQGNVLCDADGNFTVTDSGREIAANLDATLPLSVRDKALEAAMRLVAEAKARRENRVELHPDENGYRVTCHISGGETDLMSGSMCPTRRRQSSSSATSTVTPRAYIASSSPPSPAIRTTPRSFWGSKVKIK